MAIIKQTLNDSLKSAGLVALPDKGEIDSKWRKAIALVSRTIGGIQSYALVEKTPDGIKVLNDFAVQYQCSGIAEILEVYPYFIEPHEVEYVDLPSLSNKSDENAPIADMDEVERIAKLPVDTLSKRPVGRPKKNK